MNPKRKTRPKTADFPLTRDLTEHFISDLSSVLTDDPSVEAVYLRDTWLSKFTEVDAKSAQLRRQRAIEKWLSTELINQQTNKRIAQLSDSSYQILPGITCKRFFDKVASVISQVLPWTPSFDIAFGGFSGGASTSKARKHGHPAMKFLGKADVTRSPLPQIYRIIDSTRWGASMRDLGLEPRIVEGNVLFTVPKSSDIDRVACKEPDLNMFFQKSVGNQIRYLLRKRVGINLNDQSINGELARLGSIHGHLMTLDLSSASDSVTCELVKRVLPDDWFYWMNDLRSPVTSIDGITHTNEMFSSMGNGFTFELESLLFYSIAKATAYFTGVKGQLSVYGDDIIAPSSLRDELVATLAFCGFRVNDSKSYWTGKFRESCGKHWHDGQDISPFYLRRPFQTISDLILTLNQLTSWASRVIRVVDPRYEALLLKYREYIPEMLWGGQDLTSRSSLVTGHRARKELVWPQVSLPQSHVGGLLFWLHATLFSECARVESLTVAASKPPAFARVRNQRDVRCDGLPIFLSEYGR